MTVNAAISSSQFEELVDELNLTPKIIPVQPPNLTLPDHMDGFVALDRSTSCLEFSESLLGVYSTLDRSMVLFQDVVQVLYRPMSASPPERSFLL
jgi:hypothetical protein